ATLTFTFPAVADQTVPQLDSLFERLRVTPDAAEAAEFEGQIWRLWTVTGNPIVDRFVALGLEAMAAEDYGSALTVFDEVVKMVPDYAEGYNKRATIHYLTGDLDASEADIAETLKREPRHFGALSGLGLVNLARGREADALAAFDRALAVHPHLPGANTHIRALREKLKGRGI
ncbi:MAG: tetratricopeptide repeat protein, partial [Rhodospirillaceae bacterium]